MVALSGRFGEVRRAPLPAAVSDRARSLVGEHRWE
jgi:hypothetical protein